MAFWTSIMEALVLRRGRYVKPKVVSRISKKPNQQRGLPLEDKTFMHGWVLMSWWNMDGNAKCFIIFSAILGCWSGWNGIREDEVCLYSFRFFVASSNCVHTYSLKWSCCSCARAMVSGYKKVISQVRPRVAEMMNANSSDVVPWQSWHACTILYIYIRTCKYSNCSGRHPRKCILYRALPKPWGKFSMII